MLMNTKVIVPGNDWKYGVGFLVGIIFTIMAISMTAVRYAKKNTKQ